MVIVKLRGGMGNQMFQYAMGRRLALARGTTLKLDLGWFENCKADSPRSYELHVFAIKEQIATEKEIELIKNADDKGPSGLLMRLLGRANRVYSKGVVMEKHFHFDPEILTLPDNVYVEGYWQTEKYFKDVAGVIRREFTVTAEPDEDNRQMSEIIGRSEAVSVHIRRGDYVSNSVMNRYHGLCSLDYYQKAMEVVASKVKNPHFFVFSDDSEWVKENVSSEYPMTFIDFNGTEKAYEDMRLMSLCGHHIIANSSFSWWGAWLCVSPDKIVIAPKSWFRNELLNTTDLIPTEWRRI
jgi:hypothetical protein